MRRLIVLALAAIAIIAYAEWAARVHPAPKAAAAVHYCLVPDHSGGHFWPCDHVKGPDIQI